MWNPYKTAGRTAVCLLIVFARSAGVCQTTSKAVSPKAAKTHGQGSAIPSATIDREITEGHYSAASLLLRLAQPEQALTALDAVPLGPEDAALLRVEALDLAGRGEEALRFVSSYLQTHKSSRLCVLQAQLLVASGEPTKALHVLSSISASPTLQGEELFTVGTVFLQARRYLEAEAVFQRVHQSRPDAMTSLLIGRVYRDADRPEEARHWLHAALRQDAHIQLAHYYLGTLAIAHEGLVDLPEAEREFLQELAVNPKDLLTSLNLGIVLVQERKTTDAIPVLATIREQQRGFATAQSYLAQAYFNQGDFESTIAAASSALDASNAASPGSLNVLSLAQQSALHYVRGQARRKLGQTQAATIDFQQSQELKSGETTQARTEMTAYLSDAGERGTKPKGLALLQWATQPADEREIRSNLAAIQMRMEALIVQKAGLLNTGGHEEEAHRLLQIELRIFPESVPLTLADASMLLTSHNEQEAITRLVNLQKANPDDTRVRELLGRAYYQSNQFANAAQLLQEANSHDLGAEYALAVSLSRSGEDSKAEQAFAQLLHDHPDSAELQVLLGKASAGAGRSSEASDYLRKALDLDATVPEAHFEMGLLSLKNGDLASADLQFKAEVRLHPGTVPAKLYDGFALGLLQKHDEAVQVLQLLIRDHPAYADAYEVLGKELLASNRPLQAVPVLERAAQLNPSKAATDYQLAQAYRKLGRKTDADAAFANMKRKQDEKKQREALPVVQ